MRTAPSRSRGSWSSSLASLPECPQYRENRCPKSQVVLMAEHGTTQVTWYTTFVCKTCKFMFIDWNQAVVDKAKRNELDREIGNLVNARFRGLS
jgi:hypothetical protein